MYDAIIVGARCAGSPAAMLLARKGYRVLMVDKASFPSDTMSTHYIHQTGISKLQSWGLLDRVMASNCPPIPGMRVDFGPFALAGTPPPVDGAVDGYAPRRKVLDALLVEAAIEAGVEFREHFTVDSLIWDGDRVTGIRGHGSGGPPIDEASRMVIGADGSHSLVAKQVVAMAYNEVPARSCAYYSYWSGLPAEFAALYVRPDQMLITAPTNDDQSLIINYWPVSQFHRVRTDVEGSFLRALESVPEFADRVRSGERAEPFRGTADLNNFYRKPYGPGWALVGDAAYHKDPITAQGISDAFRDAELLAHAIDDGFAGRQHLETALAAYEEARNAASMALYTMTCEMAALGPPSEMQQQLIGALIGNQAQIDKFLGTVTGTYPIPEFYSEENMAEILGARAA